MATLNETTEEKHIRWVYTYINWTTAVILIIVVACFFFKIPKDNEKFVDIGLGILLGILSSNQGTATGNNNSNKKQDPTIQQTGDNPVVNATPITDTPTDEK